MTVTCSLTLSEWGLEWRGIQLVGLRDPLDATESYTLLL